VSSSKDLIINVATKASRDDPKHPGSLFVVVSRGAVEGSIEHGDILDIDRGARQEELVDYQEHVVFWFGYDWNHIGDEQSDDAWKSFVLNNDRVLKQRQH